MLTKTKLAIVLATFGLGFATSSFALVGANPLNDVQGATVVNPTQETQMVARRGADDAPGHVRQGRGADDAPGHIRRSRGADDAPGHIRRGRGTDDAPGHIRREDRRADRRQS